MRVFVTGASGFVGTHVVRALLERGHTVRALVRPGSEEKVEARGEPGVEVVPGDASRPSTLNGGLDGVEAVVHLIGLLEERPRRQITFERAHVECTRNVVEVAHAAGVERFVHMSANGADPASENPYASTKGRAEALVREAGFPHAVVFRPSLMFGAPGPGQPEFASRLWKTVVRPFPILPVLGDGRYPVQPIHVTAVAAAFAQALERPEAAGRTFVAAGPEVIPFDEALDRIAAGAGRPPKPKVHLPLSLARLLVGTLGRAGLLPITPVQFDLLLGGNTGDPSGFFSTFDVTTPRFDAGSLAYLADA